MTVVVSPMRRALVGVPVLLVVLLALAPPVEAACQQRVEGSLLVPSILPSPPAHLPADLDHGVSVWVVEPSGSDYQLAAVADLSRFCVPSDPPCTVRATLPDFNVAWYDADDVQLINHNADGDQSGAVPATAAYGLVYMALGPDVTLLEGPLSDGDAKARFTLGFQCAAQLQPERAPGGQ